jgi:hypothetical protein
MPIFLERMILPALAALLVAFGLTNPLALSWPVRVVGSVIVLAVGLGIGWGLHRHNQRKSSASPKAQEPAPPITLPDGRVLIRERPEHLMRMCSKLLRIEADRVTAPYKGKWIKITGDVEDILKQSSTMFLYLTLRENKWCGMTFDSAAWADHLNLLVKGSRIRVLGKIESIHPDKLYLTECELVADE